jgi:hypothetical protein
MGTGFVAVILRFPADPTAHRVAHVVVRADGTESGMPSTWTVTPGTHVQVRAACAADDPSVHLYELSAPTAAARGAVACTDPECFGGDR